MTRKTIIYDDGRYLTENPDWHVEDSAYKANLVAKIVERNGLEPRTVADVGCGAGEVTALLAARFPNAELIGFDVSADAQGFWAQRSRPNLHYERKNYTALDSHFDLALCLDVFEHVEDYFGFLRSLKARSDHIVFNIPLDLSVIKLVSPGLRRARDRVGHLHYFNRYTALATLADTGFEVVDSFLATPLFSTLPRNPLQWLMAAPRMALSAISKQAAATLVGGHSLVVLARCEPTA